MLRLKKIVNPYEWERSHLTGSYILPGATYYEDDEDGFIIRADEYAELKKRKKEEEFDYSRLIGAQNEREYSEMMRQMYREYNQGVLRGLVEMDSTLKTTVTGKMTVVSGSDDKGSALVSYPIEIEAKSNVTNTDVLKQYDEINNKCTINSAKLSEVEISKFFEYEPKFNLNPSIRSLIEKYKEVK